MNVETKAENADANGTLPKDVAAGLAVFCLILTNHGFDLDGLADTFDGLAVKSSGDPEKDRAKRLLVMKDSATGAAGVMAIAVVLLLKFVLVKAILGELPRFSRDCPLFDARFFEMDHRARHVSWRVGAGGWPWKDIRGRDGSEKVACATWPVVVLCGAAVVSGVTGTGYGAAAAFYGGVCVGGYLRA